MHTKIAANAHSMRRWLGRAEQSLGNHSERLNAINIFPVADSDTGTNLYHTVRAASAAAEVVETSDLGELLSLAGQAAMEEARGNSGTLFSVMLSAIAEPLRGTTRLTGPLLATGLRRARIRSWSALSDPVPGTMLSVLEAASYATANVDAAANGDDSNSGLAVTLRAGVDAAREAVVVTESQIGALTEAKVVDAGGVGFLLILDALRAAVLGEALAEELLEGLSGLGPRQEPVATDADGDGGSEVMCTINLTPLDAAGLRMQLDELGESVIMSAVTEVAEPVDGYRWRVHAHVPDPTTALSLIRRVGDPANITVTELGGEGLGDGTGTAGDGHGDAPTRAAVGHQLHGHQLHGSR